MSFFYLLVFVITAFIKLIIIIIIIGVFFFDFCVSGTHLTMTSKDGVSKERIDYEMPFSKRTTIKENYEYNQNSVKPRTN